MVDSVIQEQLGFLTFKQLQNVMFHHYKSAAISK